MAVKWNQERLNTTLRQYLVVTQLTVTQALNKKGYDLVLQSSKFTKVADADDITAAMGPTGKKVVGQKVRFMKRGGIKRGKEITENTFTDLAIAIAITRVGGKTHPWSNVLEMANKIWRARLRSRAFIKQGLIPAKEILKRSDRGGDTQDVFSDADLEKFGRRGQAVLSGGADPAKHAWTTQVKIWNAVPDGKHTNSNAYKEAEMAMEKGMAVVAQDIIVYLDRKMGKDARAFNAKQK